MDERPDPAPPAKHRESSVKETLESILIAFVLAFIFRAFVVEAFVIPTGSMATTLLGAHMRFDCPDCGFHFKLNYQSSRPETGDEMYIPAQSEQTYRDLRCPNCGYELPAQQVNRPYVAYGDRILVLKYLYLFQQPQRWDVVVFKSPDREPNGAPPTYTQNYIKRLIGRPNETIVLLDGDVYAAPSAKPDALAIQPKPRYVQEALWRCVYDNDYYPLGLNRLDPWRQPWTVRSGSGWSGPSGGASSAEPGQRRVFEFDAPEGASTIAFDREANPSTRALTDYLVYDAPAPGPDYVSDVKLHFFYDRKVGDGALRLRLTKRDDSFIAELTPEKASLYREGPAGRQLIGQAPLGRVTLDVEFATHDYRVALRINGRELIATTPEQYHPDVPRLLEEFRQIEQGRRGAQPGPPAIEIAAERQQCSLSHISLWRDIYYVNLGRRNDGRMPLNGSPSNPLRLGPDEYFVLGDNSLLSSDARFWSIPIDLPWENLQVDVGRVPGRFLLGRAFFVYWPAGFRPFPGAPPIAPDFGDLRFIH